MGWNTVTWERRHRFVDGLGGERFYFVHSFAPEVSDHTAIGVTEYGARFAAVVGAGNLFATQFHPEKSGDAGLQLYENFVRAVA
jgi:glutamine amidotransferase